jgi:hypothetical protein
MLLLLAGGIAAIAAAYAKLSHVTAEVHGTFIRSIAERTQMTLNLFSRPIVDHQHIALECARSGVPVFLKTGRDEAFYIRSGPASIRLSMSEALKYIRDSGAEA